MTPGRDKNSSTRTARSPARRSRCSTPSAMSRPRSACRSPSALAMATSTPARLLGLDDRIGRLAPGCEANLVHLTDALEVAGVWIERARASPRTARRLLTGSQRARSFIASRAASAPDRHRAAEPDRLAERRGEIDARQRRLRRAGHARPDRALERQRREAVDRAAGRVHEIRHRARVEEHALGHRRAEARIVAVERAWNASSQRSRRSFSSCGDSADQLSKRSSPRPMTSVGPSPASPLSIAP